MENLKKQGCVLVGGIHGDDYLGLGVLTHYFRHSQILFQLVLGNHEAMNIKKPWVDIDLLTSGVGEAGHMVKEKARAAEIHEVLIQHDYAVSIHGSYINDNLIVITNTDPKTLAMVSALGYSKAIVVPKANYLLDTVPYNAYIINKVAVKHEAGPDEVANIVLKFEKSKDFFSGEWSPTKTPDLYTIDDPKDRTIQFLLKNSIEGRLVEYKG